MNGLNDRKRMLLALFLGMTYSAGSFAFPCFFTVAKDSCWTNYDVRVSIIDTKTNKNVVSIDIPKGKSWGRASLECLPSQQFLFTATFEPSFWQGEQGKVYSAKQYWTLPTVVGKEDKGWDIPICYPSVFAEVPLPPGVSGNCQCNFNDIPAPQP